MLICIYECVYLQVFYIHAFFCMSVYLYLYILCVCVCILHIFMYLHCVCVWVHAVSVCVLMLAVVFVHAYSLVLFAKLWTRQILGYTSEITICACNRC